MPGARILLVEDNAILCDLLRRNLEARAHSVCVADDARTALVCLRTTLFDLVILDINLPDQTGWEVLRIAQREGRLRPHLLDGEVPCLPVVVVSAVRASLSRLKEFPLLAYLPKPFPMEALLRLAEEAAQRRPGNTQEQGNISAPPYPTSRNVQAS
jgi:DNA-binding response OmpR family regulator